MMRLYAVTDRAWVGKMTLAQQVEAALQNGVTCVQLRESIWTRRLSWPRPKRWQTSATGMGYC